MEKTKIKEKLKTLSDDLKVNLETIEKDMTKFGLEQLGSLKTSITEVEKFIKENSEKKKVKTITISADVHSSVKKYCADNEQKMSDWVESVLTSEIENVSK